MTFILMDYVIKLIQTTGIVHVAVVCILPNGLLVSWIYGQNITYVITTSAVHVYLITWGQYSIIVTHTW